MDISIVLLLLVSSNSIGPIKSQCTKEKALSYFKRSVYEFSMNLVNRIAKENEDNFVTATLSPWIMISDLSFGADCETLGEIRNVFRIHQHKCFYTKFLKIIRESRDGLNGTIIASSSIFIDNNILNENYKQSTVGINTNIIEQPFRNIDIALNNINRHINVDTQGTIEDVVIPSDIEPGKVLMIDALFFKGMQNRFSRFRTRRRRFYDSDRRNQIGYANYLQGILQTNITFISYIGTILEIPYDNNKLSILLILPNQGATVSSVLNRLKLISLRTIFARYERSKPWKVYMEIPRFRITSIVDLHRILAEYMGLEGMFGGGAWFPGLLDGYLHEFKFIQEVKIEMARNNLHDFEGEYSVATGCVPRSFRHRFTGYNARFMANKPFLFMIVDKRLEIVLATGAYSKPRVY